MLWALPLALVPVVLHLLNRMRYRDVPWAAMRFLVKANSASTRQAKLRQFLILLCRVMALAAMVFVLSRPLAGGWLGWAVSGTPEVVIVLLDRSASMETHESGAAVSQREKSLRMLAGAAKIFGTATRLVLIDSATREARELAAPELLPEVSAAAPTDTAANLPAMVDTAAEWLTRHPVGNAEVWIATDLQRSNWNPQASAWRSASARLEAAPGTVRVRVLDAGAITTANASIEVTKVDWRRRVGGGSATPGPGAAAKAETGADVMLTLRIQRLDSASAMIPLAITLNGVRSTSELKVEGQDFYVRKVLPIEGDTQEAWGKVEIPADANERDNSAWFVARPPSPQLHAVVADDSMCSRILGLAAAPAPTFRPQRVETFSPRSLPTEFQKAGKSGTSEAASPTAATPGTAVPPAAGSAHTAADPSTGAGPEGGSASVSATATSEAAIAAGAWTRFGAILWQGQLPTGETATMLQAYVKAGGVLVFFPSASTAVPAPAADAAHVAPAFGGVVWGAVQTSPKEDGWRVGSWDEQDGPLSKSEEGMSLPVNDLRVQKRQEILPGDGTILARYGDGLPFLVRARSGAGAVYFCSSLPLRDWSTLGRGDVLLPMVQRMVNEGARRLSTPFSLACGEPLPLSADGWMRLSGGANVKESAPAVANPDQAATGQAPVRLVPELHAGVYRGSPGLIAVDRPAMEDDPQRMEQSEALRSLTPLSVSLLSAGSLAAPSPTSPDSGGGLQGEVWRGFLITMLLLLVAEAALTLPAAPDPKRTALGSMMAGSAGSSPPAQRTSGASVSKREAETAKR